jgi:23S rRNA G2069 N7-methylase RlmK/C1962 C5-methylase RlmI
MGRPNHQIAREIGYARMKRAIRVDREVRVGFGFTNAATIHAAHAGPNEPIWIKVSKTYRSVPRHRGARNQIDHEPISANKKNAPIG